MFMSVHWLHCVRCSCCWLVLFGLFQAEDGIRDLVRSRGLGDVYKRQAGAWAMFMSHLDESILIFMMAGFLASAIDGALGLSLIHI